jgi:hypothetical protein
LHIDNFYNAASNLILFRLKKVEFESSEIYNNFYKNIWEPLHDKVKLSVLIQFLFNNEKYKNIKKRIRNKLRIYIEAIIYSYIYCLNELSDEDDYDEQFFYQFIKWKIWKQ